MATRVLTWPRHQWNLRRLDEIWNQKKLKQNAVTIF
jgi:hypothetical protein